MPRRCNRLAGFCLAASVLVPGFGFGNSVSLSLRLAGLHRTNVTDNLLAKLVTKRSTYLPITATSSSFTLNRWTAIKRREWRKSYCSRIAIIDSSLPHRIVLRFLFATDLHRLLSEFSYLPATRSRISHRLCKRPVTDSDDPLRPEHDFSLAGGRSNIVSTRTRSRVMIPRKQI